LTACGANGNTGVLARVLAVVARGTVPVPSSSHRRVVALAVSHWIIRKLLLATHSHARTIALMESSLNGTLGQSALLNVGVDFVAQA